MLQREDMMEAYFLLHFMRPILALSIISTAYLVGYALAPWYQIVTISS
jgi:hypothetical protein